MKLDNRETDLLTAPFPADHHYQNQRMMDRVVWRLARPVGHDTAGKVQGNQHRSENGKGAW